MKNFTKANELFKMITIQSSIAIIVGFAAMMAYYSFYVPSGVKILNHDISRMKRSEAKKEISNLYSSSLDKSYLIIKFKGLEEYNVLLTDLFDSIDKNHINEENTTGNFVFDFFDTFPNEFLGKNENLQLPFKFNLDKITSKISEYAKKIESNKNDAKALINNGRLEIIPDKIGRKVNVEALSKYVYEYLQNGIGYTIDLSGKENLIVEQLPTIRVTDLQDYTKVLSIYNLKLWKDADKDSIKKISEILDNTIIEDKFSMIKKINRSGDAKKLDDESISVAASTIFAAMLEAGIPYGSMEKSDNSEVQNYIRPGLDVKISKNEAIDFSISNATDSNLLLISELKGDILETAVVSTKDSSLESKKLEFVEQKFKASSIVEVMEDMKDGEKKVITHGKDGMTVWVYAINVGIQTKKPEKPIFQVKYSPVKSLIYVGPNTQWDLSEK